MEPQKTDARCELFLLITLPSKAWYSDMYAMHSKHVLLNAKR
jgi:hypothetical protein